QTDAPRPPYGEARRAGAGGEAAAPDPGRAGAGGDARGRARTRPRGTAVGSRGARPAGAHRLRACHPRRGGRGGLARGRRCRARRGPGGMAPGPAGRGGAAAREPWLAPWLAGVTRPEHLARLSLSEVLRARLTWQQQRELDELAPTHLTMPTGSPPPAHPPPQGGPAAG